MKKFLSLVLALVMTMSLVTVSAGAKDFTDDSEITYKEAVDVLSTLGVIDGYSDGNFNPHSTLTRGAAAKIICNLILGPTTASALAADSAPYADVPADSTFAGYIAYCSQQGIISGYADGTFRPGNTLTGYAFMKMLLGALGYDSEVEGYTGANWSIQVAKRALSIELDDGLTEEFNGTKAITREEACLYAFNTLKATMVEYDTKTTVTVGGATVNVGGSEADDMENKTSSDGNIKDDDLMQFAEKYFTNLKKSSSTNDDLGRPAVEWKYKSNTIGTYADHSNLEATYTAGVEMGELYTLLGKTLVEDIEEGDASLETYVDGVDGKFEVDDLFVKNSSADAGASGRGVVTEVYVNDEAGKDEDETLVTVVFINTYLVQAASDYNANKETLSINFVSDNGSTQPASFVSKIEQDDFDVSDFEEEDYLLVTWSKSAKEIQSVQAATTLTGSVESYKADNNVTIDGTTYKYNKIVGADGKNSDFSVGEEATLILDAYGYILYVDDAVASSNYVYIQEFASKSGLNKKPEAAAYFADGTDDEITVKKVIVKSGSTTTEYTNSDIVSEFGKNDGAVKAGWYTYSVNSSDEYTLKEVGIANKKYTGNLKTYSASDSKGEEYEDVISNGTVKFLKALNGSKLETVSGVMANSSTVFLVLDSDDDVTVYTGISDAPDIDIILEKGKTAHVGYVVKSNSYATLVFVDLSDADDNGIDEVGGSSTDYMFLLDDLGALYKDKTDDDYYMVDVIRDGGVTTVKVADDATTKKGDDSDFSEGVLYNKVKTDSNGYISGASEIVSDDDQIVATNVSSSSAAIKYKNDTLSLNGEYYILNDGCDINLIVDDEATDLLQDDDADYETYLGITGSALAGYLTNYDYTYDFYAILDDDDSSTIDALYVWITEATSTDDDESYTVTYDYDEELVTVTGSTSVEEGKNLTFTVKAEEGVTVTSITVDGTAITVTKSGSYTVKNVKDDVEIVIEAEMATVDVQVTYVDEDENWVGEETIEMAKPSKSYVTVKADDLESIPDGYELVNASQTKTAKIDGDLAEVTFVVKEVSGD